MNILMIDHHRLYRCWHRAGSFASECVKQGHHVTLMVLSDKNRFTFKEHRRNGLHIIECPDIFTGKMRSGWDPVCAIRRLWKLHHVKTHFDVIHLFETRPSTILPGLTYSRLTNTPLVIDWCDWWGGPGGIIEKHRPRYYRMLLGNLETWFEEYFRRFADASTVISTGLARRAKRLVRTGTPIVQILPGIDKHRFGNLGRETIRIKLNYAANDFAVCYASQDASFDIEPVLLGVKAAFHEGCPIRLFLLGNYNSIIQKKIFSIGIQTITTITGFVPDELYPQYLAAADVFALPFPNETCNIGRWPNKFGDYCATGRPIVFNPTGDLKEFDGDSAPGIAVDFTNEAFTEAFLTLWKDPKRRAIDGQKGRALAENSFNWIDRVRSLEKVYMDACKNHYQQKSESYFR